MNAPGLAVFRGDAYGGTAEALRVEQARAGEGDDPWDAAAPELPGDGDDPLAGELAALDRALDRSNKILAGAEDLVPLLAAALLWHAWERNLPLERQAWIGNLLVPAMLREQKKRGRICSA